MAQLETLQIFLESPVPNRDVERQLLHTPITTHVTLRNLRWFGLVGANAYMEAVVRRITTLRLEKLDLQFFKQLTFTVPHLLQFMGMTESLRFESVNLEFSIGDGVFLKVYPSENLKAGMYSFQMSVICWHLDWQVSSVAQILNALSRKCSTVEHLTLEHTAYHSLSSEEHNDIDRTEWRKLLGPFSNVKTLHVGDGLIKELSRSLRLDDGELPLELLPELQELRFSGSGDTGDAFTSFIDVR
jgi:Leucine-rich repeat (LRR) protein